MSYSLFMVFILMTLSSNSLLIVWFLIEMMMIFMIPLFKNKNINNNNNMMKYFIIQSISSSLFLLTILSQTNCNTKHINILILVIMSMKLGLFPFNTWYFQVTENMSWFMWFLINTYLKISPMWILYSINYNKLMLMLILINSMYSSMEMISQNSLRWLMNCSSLNHLSWMLISFITKTNIWEFYMLLYLIMSYCLYMFLKNNNIKTTYNLYTMNKYNMMMMMIYLLNFMGIPPMMGFISKLYIIKYSESMLYMIPILMNNIILIYYYFNLMNSFMMLNMMKKLYTMKMKNLMMMSLFLSLNMFFTFTVM